MISMKELVEFVAKSLVNLPDEVQVRERRGPNGTVIHLHVAPDEMGRVIGKGGRVANAIRVLLRVAAIREGNRVSLEID